MEAVKLVSQNLIDQFFEEVGAKKWFNLVIVDTDKPYVEYSVGERGDMGSIYRFKEREVAVKSKIQSILNECLYSASDTNEEIYEMEPSNSLYED